MNGWDILLLILLAVILALAVRRIRSDRRNGKGCLSCGGNCAGCNAQCSSRKDPDI